MYFLTECFGILKNLCASFMEYWHKFLLFLPAFFLSFYFNEAVDLQDLHRSSAMEKLIYLFFCVCVYNEKAEFCLVLYSVLASSL